MDHDDVGFSPFLSRPTRRARGALIRPINRLAVLHRTNARLSRVTVVLRRNAAPAIAGRGAYVANFTSIVE
jgi:hypothetical protein